ncbi:hypothetical protein [Nonomuraea dietziae]|uniref:hypothetical protein n=1 Tax=Nonomuraea dietziae TaxID=65515 RepID=UPI0031CF6827
MSSSGFTIYLTATCLGLTAIFALVPAAYTALKLAGRGLPRVAGVEGRSARRRIGVRGARARARLEPQALLHGAAHVPAQPQDRDSLYLSLLPQFIDSRGGKRLLQSLALGSCRSSSPPRSTA